jgi:hypothetical protein
MMNWRKLLQKRRISSIIKEHSIQWSRSNPAPTFSGGYMKEILLTQGKVAIVDDEDYEYLSQWSWCYSGGYANRYFHRKMKSKSISMHRMIMNTPDNMDTDHINHNTLDNRRCNLRICDKFQNNQNRSISKNNTSGRKGVAWYKRYGKWRVQIQFNNKKIHVGYYDDIDDASKAYNKKAKELFGEFANVK